jgi:cobyrinic acid a,c-diamide synthase
MNAFLIAGTNSGVGKTTITLALISYFKKKGLNVQPFKVGPDFIDPGYHKLFSNNHSINLDGWMLSKKYNISNFKKHTANKNISIVEGVMGLFDGFSGTSDKGSSSQMAKWLNIPVILIVNAKSMARSIAAVVYGFENFDKNLKLTGVILNNVSSDNHYSYLENSIKKYCKTTILGYFKKGDFPAISSRHLGLVTVEDNIDFINYKNTLAEIVEKRINIKKLLSITKYPDQAVKNIKRTKKKVKIAVARDKAFSFYYYDNLKLIEQYGGEIVFFSPLSDNTLPAGIKAIYLGGGYPEIYAEQLSKNSNMINEIKTFSKSGGYIYAECGGFIYLTEGVYDFNGKFSPLVGVFKEQAIMEKKLKALGYAEVTLQKDSFFGEKNLKIRGHEFHYSYLKNNGKNLIKIYNVKMRKHPEGKQEGYSYKNTLGSYIHLHFGSNQNIVKNFIQSIL